ncbi:hypothetical protein F4779DRAFT_635131 [Xylariaceae sp. FL0662B]|nr:hypothetical protein F4779DRAFT_635131 [Xylariaceae sp. FL0662B]
MSMFRAKKLDIGCFINVKTLRDHTKRKTFAQFEPERQALRYIIRNTTLPARTRAEAQLQLTQMHCYTRPTQIRGRCILGGKGRGIFRDFKMSRYNFRMQALEGNIPGVRKASCAAYFTPTLHPSTFSIFHLPHDFVDRNIIIFIQPPDKMFRRKWSGLPADPSFPSDLKELGYFVNKDDEVRSIENENNYFKFFISRNPRWNDRQRFGMNQAIQKVIHERLENLGLKKVPLPLDTTDTSQPHVPIFVSADIKTKSRVVIIFGESSQDLGVLAHRVIGGAGGVNKGSLVSIVAALQQQRSSSTDAAPPGIILANMGELLWWPAGARTLSPSAFRAAPMKSAVHQGHDVTAANEVPENRTLKDHVGCVFGKVLPRFVDPAARLDLITVGDAADFVEHYLDWDPAWKVHQGRINCLAIVGGLQPVWELTCESFKEFLRKKARAYILSHEPAGLILSGPDGNPRTGSFTQMGCPVASSGEAAHTETTLIAATAVVLAWLQEVALAGADYENPVLEIVYADPPPDYDDAGEPGWGGWKDEDAPADQQPQQEQQPQQQLDDSSDGD